MKFGDVQKEYRFPFKAQVALESGTGASLDQCLANIGRRTILSQAVFVMLDAAERITLDEVYGLLDVQNEAGGLDNITETVLEELMVALGNPQADIKQYVKALKLERAKGKRAAKTAIAEMIKGLEAEEGAKEPPGPGETSKSSA